MLRHTSIHTYNIPEETNPLSGYVLCVWSEHGWTRLTPGGTQQECWQPLFSTVQHAAHKHRCPSHGPFVLYPCCHRQHGQLSLDIYDWLFNWAYGQTHQRVCVFFVFYSNNHVPIQMKLMQWKHAYACRHGIIANTLNENSGNYP